MTTTVDAYVDSYFSTQTSCSKAVELRAHSCRIQRNSFPGVATCTSHKRACSTAKLCVNMRTLSSFWLPLAIHTQGACLLAGSTNANLSFFQISSFTRLVDNWSYWSNQNTYPKTKTQPNCMRLILNLQTWAELGRTNELLVIIHNWICRRLC